MNAQTLENEEVNLGEHNKEWISPKLTVLFRTNEEGVMTSCKWASGGATSQPSGQQMSCSNWSTGCVNCNSYSSS